MAESIKGRCEIKEVESWTTTCKL